jgi:hypothetical protein
MLNTERVQIPTRKFFGLCRYPTPEPTAEIVPDVEHGESSNPNKEEKTLVPNLKNVVTCQKTGQWKLMPTSVCKRNNRMAMRWLYTYYISLN